MKTIKEITKEVHNKIQNRHGNAIAYWIDLLNRIENVFIAALKERDKKIKELEKEIKDHICRDTLAESHNFPKHLGKNTGKWTGTGGEIKPIKYGEM